MSDGGPGDETARSEGLPPRWTDATSAQYPPPIFPGAFPEEQADTVVVRPSWQPPLPARPSRTLLWVLVATVVVLVGFLGFMWLAVTGMSDPKGEPLASTTVTAAPTTTSIALNIDQPITEPACDGTGIVVLGNAVTPGSYDAEIQQFLNRFPGSSYLRTDHSCPSLRQRSDTGTMIYAVYRPAGRTEAEVCAAVRAAGSGAYGKWLDRTTPPTYIIPC